MLIISMYTTEKYKTYLFKIFNMKLQNFPNWSKKMNKIAKIIELKMRGLSRQIQIIENLERMITIGSELNFY